MTVRQVLMVDDHVAVSEGLRGMLGREMPDLEFAVATSWDAAIAMCPDPAGPDDKWHLAILDLDLGGRSGLELIAELRKRQPNLAILVYSFHKEAQFGMRALKAGAKGYLNKSAAASQIFDAVRALLNGGSYVSPDLETLLIETVAAPQPGSAHHALANREWEVLRRIVAGTSIKQIALDLGLSQKTVSTYRARILGKLSLRSTADLVRYAITHGIETEQR